MNIRLFILSVCIILSFQSFGQKHTLNYGAEAGGAIPADKLPFWLHSNTYGKIAPDAYLWGNIKLFSDFRKADTRKFDYAAGAEATGALGKDDHRLFINQLYGRIRWQNLVLNLGILNPPTIYDGLSSTNGNMLYSTNSRSMPGVDLSTWDYIKLPWIGRWVSFRAKYAEYTMIDDRYAGNRTRLHNKMVGIKLTFIPQISLEGGMEHFAQWGGEIPGYGKLPHSFKDYARVVFVKAGGEDSPENDLDNKLGNHIGMHFARLRYNGSKWGAELYYNHMFEDGSGQHYQNKPDGLYGFYLTRKTSPKWFKSFLYEFYYTKSQSGPNHNDPETGEIIGGNDNYFNNSMYQSGWTFYGNVIGAPFFTPWGKTAEGITPGVFNSRFVAHHIGVCGELPWDIQYKLMMSYSENYGMHHLPSTNEQGKRISKPQFSFGLELVAPDLHLPFGTALNIGFDKGDLLENNFGVMLKIFKTGILCKSKKQ